MRTPTFGLLTVLAVPGCYKTGPTYSIGYDDAYAVVTGLAKIAQDAGEGTGIHTCPSGGRTTLDAATVSEQRGDTIVTSSRWQLVPDECRFAGIMVSGKPDVVFSTETTVTRNGARLVASITGGIFWRYEEGGESCQFDLSVETSETDADGAFVGTLTPRSWTCADLSIPLSDLRLFQP